MARAEVKEFVDIEKLYTKAVTDSKVLRKAVRAGGMIVRKRAMAIAPVESPNVRHPEATQLKDSIRVLVKPYNRDQLWVAIVGPDPQDAPHGFIAQYGHAITGRGPKGQSARGQNKPTAAGPRRVVGDRFMERAAKDTHAQAEAAVIKSLKKSFEEQI